MGTEGRRTRRLKSILKLVLKCVGENWVASRRSKVSLILICTLHFCLGPKVLLEKRGLIRNLFVFTAFVKSDRPGKFPNFSVKYMGGQMPQIKLLEKDGSVAETLSITKWDTDTIEEFLQTYLLSADEVKDDENNESESDPTKNEL
jgi:hypothetical protein